MTAEIFFHPGFLFNPHSNAAMLNSNAYTRGRHCASSDNMYRLEPSLERWSFYGMDAPHRRLAFELGYSDRWHEINGELEVQA